MHQGGKEKAPLDESRLDLSIGTHACASIGAPYQGQLSNQASRPDLRDQGLAAAQTNLGHLMFNGARGMQRNRNVAVSLYRKAAQQGYAPAQRSLGDVLLKGKVVPKNFEEGVSWLVKAARQGDQKAQKTLTRLNVKYDVEPNPQAGQ